MAAPKPTTRRLLATYVAWRYRSRPMAACVLYPYRRTQNALQLRPEWSLYSTESPQSHYRHLPRSEPTRYISSIRLLPQQGPNKKRYRPRPLVSRQNRKAIIHSLCTSILIPCALTVSNVLCTPFLVCRKWHRPRPGNVIDEH